MQDEPLRKAFADIADAVEKAAASAGFRVKGAIDTIALSRGFGDVSCSIAFRIGKESSLKPEDVAAKIAKALKKPESVKSVAVEKGYINFDLDRGAFSGEVIHYSMRLAKGGQISKIGGSKKVIVEYPSANPVHPLHVGQLRNMLLGDAVANIYDACGYNVERIDYIDDLGLQMLEAMYGYMRQKQKPTGKFDHWLGSVYAGAHKQTEEKDLSTELSKLAGLMEQHGTYESKLAREVAEQCVRAHYQTAFDYGSYRNVLVWESDILREKLLDRAVKLFLENGFMKRVTDGQYKGCVVIDLGKIKNLPNELKGIKDLTEVIIKSNGTPTYLAKDIAFHMWKFGMIENQFKYSVFIGSQANGKPLFTTSESGERMEFGGASSAINIIDVKQSYPQSILKLAFESAGRADIAKGIMHLAYGRVELEDGKLAGRKGIEEENTADGLLEEARNRASHLIRGKVEMGKEEREKVAVSVALAAIKYEFLKVTPEKWITFSWKWALNFEGNSGPYCQYMHARATRLLEDSGMESALASADVNAALLKDDSEFALVKRLSELQDVAEKACNEYRPNVMAVYANELAYSFGRFYENVSVLKAGDDELKKARLALALSFKKTMAMALNLLGIEALEKM